MVVLQALERTTFSELWTYLAMIVICGTLYTLSGFLKTCFLALRLKGPKAHPLIGNCLLITRKDMLTREAAHCYKLYGPIIRIWIMFFPMFVVLEPEDLQLILSSKKHTDKIFFYKLLHNFLGNGLITSSGEQWSLHRKWIQPTFHMNILEKFIGTFADSAQCLHDKLKNAPIELNITSFVNDCVLDILNESVLGVPILRQDKSDLENSPFRDGKVVVPYRVTRPWLLFNWIYNLTETASTELNQKKRLDAYTLKMITERRAAKANNEKTERKSLLDYMLDIADQHPEFTDMDIVNEACTFMLAGQDSVGAAMAFCFFLLAQNQEDQNKCIEELDDIFGDDDRAPTMNDLRGMRYLEMCIKETMRLYPSVPLIARRISEDIPMGKRILPAGSDVVILPYATHRLPHIFENPEKFIPDRFSPENCEKRHPYAFLPFSAGPRNCIGHKFAIIEMKTVISKVLRNFHLQPVAGKTTIMPLFRITVRAQGGLWVRLEPRNNNNSSVNLNVAKNLNDNNLNGTNNNFIRPKNSVD